VFIVAQPQSGLVLAKSFYRVIGTLIGAVVALAFIALVAQERVLFLGAFTLDRALHIAATLRLTGDVLLAIGDSATAEAHYSEALDIARLQSAKLWELHAAISLARLRGDQGKAAEARDLLAPVYGWFTEGFGTPVFQEAKALLDELH
jgi:predicted ATPase